ncbi:DegT/DnrJ/EryC1/StrS family aminotransferase [Phycisphaera mikurensis]|uniref:Putative aminotransferase n=1 Tax=Phycisphaera mikurensis (strain NBRC 102666 / KCTC 22515 / FYK2301M01) TaxID=1142394 RepID=I0IGZ4_PHYMF|nr:DegT/DnrJ/EryC1/StrS family aminotransferase [Phycisphaera mikurensis]MBB6440789.1 dTDP-4-amino-4,6-dideoxygalactose transaminase [Phycisphaera mikurensis]BAM04532.1 putative aminotransferase [Phycisphaera mikurensis NBRC 102666]
MLAPRAAIDAHREEAAPPILFNDLATQQARIRERVERRLREVLDHGRYIDGPEIEELEARLASAVGVSHCIACSSGTDALLMALLACGLRPGDAVMVPAFTYNATANAVVLAGGVPAFVDVDPASFMMDSADLAERVRAARSRGLRPRVVLAVDLFGAPADYAALREVCQAEGLTLYADAAQSFGGELAGRRVGSLAAATATSFYPGKALGGYGDGGALFTDDPGFAAACRSVRWHGTDEQRVESVRVGINGRMSSFQAAVLLEKEAIFWDEREARRRVAAVYDERLAGLAEPQAVPPGARSGCGYHTVAVDHRDRVAERMAAEGVPTAVYYRVPLHRMAAFAAYASGEAHPAAESVAGRVLSLPMHAYLTDAQAHRVCDALERSLGR